MDDPALQLRKVVGKFVLLLAGVWAMLLIAAVALLPRDNGVGLPGMNWMMAVLPGCALVPGAYVSMRLLRTDEPDRISELWIQAAIYGVAGVAIGISSVVALVKMRNGVS